MRARRTVTAFAVLIALLAPGTTAVASFHEMLIEEIDTGQPGQPELQFVDLQMYEPGQNIVGGKKLRVYAADGSAHECTIPSNVPAFLDDSHVLFAATNPIHSVIPDFVMPAILDGAGGALCFADVDCVSWGSFAGSTSPSSGTPLAQDFAGSLDSMHRSKGGDDVLQKTDDTNNSQEDFSAAAPDPQHNSGSATQMSCQPVTVTDPPPPDDENVAASLQGLKAKVKRGKATVRGRIVPPAPGEKVKLAFFANGSPLRKVAKAKVALNDQSRFKKRFKVPADSTRCKVVVRFGGSRVGKKKFRC